MTVLSIYLFGSMRVVKMDRELPMRPASQMLLLYLLLNRAKHHRREELATLFWGDTEDTKARRCLNTALWRLRQDITDTDIISSNLQGDVTLELQSNNYLDVAEFESLGLSGLKKTPEILNVVEINNLEQAVEVYQGDLAENCFYDWVLPERERLRAFHLDILTLLMHSYSRKQAYPQAIEAGKQLLQCDPLREDVHRHLMRLYIAIDQRGYALQQYMTCWQILHDELRVTPMPETTALYEQMMGPDPFAGLTTASAPSLPELQSLHLNLDHLKNRLQHLQMEIQQTLQALQAVSRE